VAKKVKITRKQIKQDDKFLATMKSVTKTVVGTVTGSPTDFWTRWKKTIITASVVLVVVLIGLAGFRLLHAHNVKKAMTAMGAADIVFAKAVDAGDEERESLWASAAELYDGVVNDFRGTDYAKIALFHAGNCYFELGSIKNDHFNTAIDRYQAYLNQNGHNAPFATLAMQGIGYSYEALENLDGAAETFRTLTEIPEGGAIKLLSILDLARIYEKQKKWDQALEALKKVNDIEIFNNPESAQVDLAKQYKDQAAGKIKKLETRLSNKS